MGGRRVVVTGLTLALGCGAAPGHPEGAIRETPVESWTKPGTGLNAWRDGDGMIFRSAEGCVVYPDDGQQRPVGAMPPPLALPCPPSMSDPAWAACVGGALYVSEVAGECRCSVSGNPPPPSRSVPCPARG